MKRFKLFLIICLIPLLLFGCGKEEKVDNRLLLTDERVKTIENEVFLISEKLNYKELKSKYSSEIVWAANNRATAGSYDAKGVQSFSKFELDYGAKANDYEYSVYGTIYEIDDYGRSITRRINATFSCEKDESSDCKVKYNGFKMESK